MNSTQLVAEYKSYVVAAASVATGVAAYLDGSKSFTTAITSVPGLLVYLGVGIATLKHDGSVLLSKLKK